MNNGLAEVFHRLHAGPDILVLPNAWDAASAALMADAGARAVATSSAAVAWAHGYPDGDALPVDKLVASISEMRRVVSVPLTADIEGGYTDELDALARTVTAVIDAGAVGINLEDGARDPELHAHKLEAARRAADRTGVRLFINARIDVYLHRLAEGERAVEETLARAERYRSAGADGIFVPWPTDAALIGRLAAGIALPMNVMSRGGVPPAAELQSLGVRRLSSATGMFRAAFAPLTTAIRAFLEHGDPSALAAAGQGLSNLNERFAPRRP
jgi:2-methylisocitrate lyase-like PEP mutase family enzyme